MNALHFATLMQATTDAIILWEGQGEYPVLE